MLIRATGLTSTVHTEEKKVRVKASLQTTNMTTGQGALSRTGGWLRAGCLVCASCAQGTC